MLEGFSAKLLVEAGPWGLLILAVSTVVLGLMTGRLVPKSTADRNYKILEDRVAAAEKREAKWQEAAQLWQTTAQAAISDRDEQLEQGRTLIQLLTSVPRGPGRRGGN